MYCGPHHRSSGNRLASRRVTIVRRVGDQLSTGPIGVLDQSNAPISAPISPPPARNAGGSATDGFDMREAPPSRVTPSPPIIVFQVVGHPLGSRNILRYAVSDAARLACLIL